MDAITILFIVAVLIEAVVQAIKAGVPQGLSIPMWAWPLASAGLGIMLCLLAEVNAFEALGVHLAAFPWVGNVLTGILVSRGASFVHDLRDKINLGKKSAAGDTAANDAAADQAAADEQG